MSIVNSKLYFCRVTINFFVNHYFKISPLHEFAINNSKKKLAKLKNKKIITRHLNRNFTLNIIFASNQQIQLLNKRYRGRNYPTDVLTFVYEDSPINNPNGEIYISINMAEKQSKDHKLSLSDELCLLSIHGILHALGLDHDRSKEEYFLMKKHESKLLSDIGLPHVSPLTD